MRIHKVLSDNGIASRRKAEEMIGQGRVTVNGHKATLGQDINPIKDIIAIDGQRVSLRANTDKHYIALYKPRGWVTTMSDELGRKCIAQFVEDMPGKVYPIGRLDKDSEGLLLLTNDGDFANLIMHPRHHISKTYRVTVRPDVSEEQLIALSTGVEIDTGMTAPAQVTVLTKEAGRVVLRMTITEGKNRQIRKMCEAVGLEVARLRRTTIGPIQLGMLQPGEWRALSTNEVGMIRNAVTLEPSKPNPEKQKRKYAAYKASTGGRPDYKAGGRPTPRAGAEGRPAPKTGDRADYKAGSRPDYKAGSRPAPRTGAEGRPDYKAGSRPAPRASAEGRPDYKTGTRPAPKGNAGRRPAPKGQDR